MRRLVLPVIILVIFRRVGRKHVTQHKNYVSHRLNHRSLLKNYTIKALGPMFYS